MRLLCTKKVGRHVGRHAHTADVATILSAQKSILSGTSVIRIGWNAPTLNMVQLIDLGVCVFRKSMLF
jgi:hypothetical protein